MTPKLILVDDDKQVLFSTSEVFKRSGFDVTIEDSSAAALAQIKRQDFDLLIADYNLVGGTSEELLKEALNKTPPPRIIVVTGNPDKLPSWLADATIDVRVVSKPFSLVELADMAKNLISGKLMSPSFRGRPSPKSSAILPKEVEEMVHHVIDEDSIIAVTDRKGDIVYANDRFCEISGYSRSELIGQNHRILKSGKHPQAFYRDIWATILSGRKWRGEICNKAKTGRTYYVDTTITPLRDEGLITYFMAVRIDITARKEAEALLAEQAEKDEKDRKMAALGQMADGLLHDLNNILTGIMGIQAAEKQENKDELLQHAIDRMAKMTRTLRDYSTGRQRPHEVFTLSTLVECACSLVRHRTGVPQDLQLRMSIDTTADVAVKGNEAQIFEVVLNLVVNAMEAASSSAVPAVMVNTRFSDGKVTILVEDNGPGIATEIIGKLFEPYSSTKGQGRGVGLSASQSIVSAHGGWLTLDHPGGDGRGACFKLVLPAVRIQTRSHQLSLDAPSRTRRIVLVSEDESEVRQTITRHADQVGLTALHAESTGDLLAMANKMKEVLAAAILDSCEPYSEQGAVASLRRLSPELPIILISANLNIKGKQVTPWGDVVALPKPFDPAEFVHVLKSSIRSLEPL